MPKPSRHLSTAPDRRAEIDAVAVTAFADRGYYGTTTAEVAAAAGISQAYLYKLYPDKTAIFVAAIDHVSDRLADMHQRNLRERGATAALHAAGEVVAIDPPLTRFLMHAGCAAVVPEIADAVRQCYAKQYAIYRAAGDVDDAMIRRYFADSLLANVMHTISAQDVDAGWVHALTSIDD